MAKTLGKETLDHVVEVTGVDGMPQPYQWKITLREPTGGSREVDVAGGKVNPRDPEAKSPDATSLIHLSDLNLDSSGAFDATDAQARKVRLRFDSVNYVLRASDATGKPQWSLRLYNQAGVEVGKMRLAANDGSIISTDGRLASGPTPPTVASSTHRNEVTANTPPAVRPRETVGATPRLTESRTTVTTTVVNPPPPPVATITDTEPTEEPPVDRGEGGLFTRTGRTLDKTNRNVQDTLRKTSTRLQRFFTGHIGPDQDETAPPPPPRNPDYRGD